VITLRDAHDDDGLDVAALLGAVFSEYDGCLFIAAEMPELRRLATTFREADGAFFVAHREVLGVPVLVGCVGYTTHGDTVELKKLYVAKPERRTGLGARLVATVEEAATARGASAIDLWSDTRFETAHRFYERRGYERTGAMRPLHDASATEEFYFRKPLTAG
jgi:putative acetyltransferase